MADDFARLVSRTNPAAQQYQQPAYQQQQGGYPPRSSDGRGGGGAMDPFFDDDDADSPMPDSAFRPAPLVSHESGLNLTRSAQPMAGGNSSMTLAGGEPQGWSFDDDQPFPGSGNFNGLPQHTSSSSRNVEPQQQKPVKKPREPFKWPWNREKVYVGERKIALNNHAANAQEDFMSNYVSTTKYNLASFLPKFFYEQFSRYANLFFLFTVLIQQIPDVSPTNPYTTIPPLSLVLLASAFKEIQEDLKRHQSDSELNARACEVLQEDGTFKTRRWRDIRVGDVVRLPSDAFIPADMVLLSSSEPEGLCYIETANLDGETNLKIKQASSHTSGMVTPASVLGLRGTLRSEQPNNSLYTYEATMDLLTATGQPKQVPLGPDQILLRGAQLRNTPWVYGLAVFTGHETKLMRNATAAPIKRTAVERQVNVQIVFLFILLLFMSVASTLGGGIRSWFFDSKLWYLAGSTQVSNRAKQFVEDILTFIILYNNLIPISLIVTMEVVKFQQAVLINSDLDMYHAATDTPALCRTSSLVEELGQIAYIFSDKTGTLTCNEMEFKMCSIAGTAYADVVDENKRGDEDDPDSKGWKTFAQMQDLLRTGVGGSQLERNVVQEFLTLLAVCHTVIPEVKDDKIVYQASSPDEAALVAGAELLGYRFHTRKPKSVFVDIHGQTMEFEILNVCEFNSTRKRMSTIVRGPDGRIKLFCKGADTVILERLSQNQPFTEQTLIHLEDYATEGLRTLCIASREIPESEYQTWSTMYDSAAAQISGRGDALDRVAESIEKDMFLLGATAIEDKLQDGVPDTIFTLQQAGIRIWVLTGDRQETAINIGLSCKLISESMNLVIVNEDNAHSTKDFITKRLQAIKNQQRAGDEQEDLALVIDGKSLTWALEKDINKQFLELAIMCKAVVCCRVSPLQKALVVKLVKKNEKALLLAIGDGANDVSMIQAAHIGVGISGKEGLQAARSADIAIGQFRFLKKLLLVHGAWSYQRLSKLILYSFYKNITLYVTQFWFSFFNGYSGQIAYESWSLSLFNVLFTVMPPLVIGVFDQFVSARILDRYPQLYQLGQQNVFFTKTAFWLWIANSLYHSLLLYGFSIILFWGDLKQSDGRDTGHWFWGTSLYIAVILTVLGKAALISDLWTKYTVAAIPGSVLITMIIMPLYCWLAPLLGVSPEYAGAFVSRLWTDPVFYLTLLLLPTVCLVRDYVWKYYRRTYDPTSYHIAQELQKFNIPDYRPRQEQFQKAIKKVRAVQRLRKTRGFAFSQTEDSARQDQARLIRAYDTSRNHQRPSGY